MSQFTIINRRNEHVPLDFNRTYNKLLNLINMEPKLNVCAELVAQKTISMIINGISTYELDMLSSSICASLITEHIDYDSLAVRIFIDSLHKETANDMLTTVIGISNLVNKNGDLLNILNPKYIKFIENYNENITKNIDYSLDFKFDYFGIQTLCKSYLMKNQLLTNNKFNTIIERPQHLWMRVAIGIHMHLIDNDGFLLNENTFNEIINTYGLISNKYYTHATPTLFNAGCNNSALSSCFLLEVPDHLDGIYKTLTDSAKISKWSGGVGIAVSRVRSKGSLIKSTNGISEGLVPMMKLFNQSALYVSQGGGKRKGSTAVYVEPWHADIFDFLNTRRPLGDEATKCKDLFLALWIPDLFMKRLIEAVELKNINSTKFIKWSLMCPNECKGLVDSYGNDFEQLYTQYEQQGNFIRQINIIDLWNDICSTQLESGVPYIMYKDNVNKKCNQNNLGTIQSSNLCVSGDTIILTDNGYLPIKDLDGKIVNVWNGTKFSPAPVSKTGENQELIKITTSDGCELKCTIYHKFHINENNHQVIKPANELKLGDKLIKCKFPIIDGIGQESLFDKINWLVGYINSYGKVIQLDKYNKYITITTNSNDLLFELKLVGNTLGVNPKISNDILVFDLNDTNILFTKFNLLNLIEKHAYSLNNHNTDFNEKDVVIESIEELEELCDTYCFNEPINHTGIFNGIITGNCSEITIYTDKDNIGVCNLASVCLSKFVEYINDVPYYNYNRLHQIVMNITYNLNKVLDSNYYSIAEGKHSDYMNKPLGIGVQGLADVFMQFRIAFTSTEAKRINKFIFETIYHAALTASMRLAKQYGPYENYKGSMMSKGLLQFDLWGVNPEYPEWDWDWLKTKIAKYGVRNSLLIALMPTASTASIMGSSETVEPITSNIYARNVLSGKFQIVNKYLINDLIKLDLWNNEMKQKIIAHNGSIQKIKSIPKELKVIYQHVYEYKLSDLIEMDRDRGAYVCQSASSNRYITEPTITKLTKMHIHCFRLGLKTSSYYIRTQAKADAIKFTVDRKIINQLNAEAKEDADHEECMVCSA